MTDPIEAGLERLRNEPLDHNLGGLEAGVRRRIGAQRGSDVFRGRAFQIQLVVSCAALIVGLLMAELVDQHARPFRSETAVLSDDSDLAPSVRLGGAI